MADTQTPEQRRRTMQSVGTANTGPELRIRKLLHQFGYRYRLHRRDLPGSPDIVFPGRRKVLLIHGCFWHAHGCRQGRPPKSRPDYWLPKLARNKQRDTDVEEALRRLGWDVMIVWQCELRTKDILASTMERVAAFLGPPRDQGGGGSGSHSGGAAERSP